MTLIMRNIGILILSLGTCLIFFNPLNLTHEIFPYFLLALAFLKVHLRIVFSGLVIMIISSLWLFADSNSRSIIDAAVLMSMLVGCSLLPLCLLSLVSAARLLPLPMV